MYRLTARCRPPRTHETVWLEPAGGAWAEPTAGASTALASTTHVRALRFTATLPKGVAVSNRFSGGAVRIRTVDALVELDQDRQHAPGEQRADRGGPQMSQADRDTERRRHPDSGGRREPFDLAAGLDLQDRPGPEEADAGDDTLDDARQRVELHPIVDGRQHEQRRSRRDQHVRSKACGLMPDLALVADDAARDQRRKQTYYDADGFLGVGQRPVQLVEQ